VGPKPFEMSDNLKQYLEELKDRKVQDAEAEKREAE
jgi:hypothetical protein